MHSRKLIIWASVGVGIIITVGYSAFALKGIVQGPKIEVITPQNGSATTTPLVAIVGRVRRGSTLNLNGATSTLDLSGNFKETLLLMPGYNIMTLEAMDRYGRVVREIIELTLIRETIQSVATTTDLIIQNAKIKM